MIKHVGISYGKAFLRPADLTPRSLGFQAPLTVRVVTGKQAKTIEAPVLRRVQSPRRLGQLLRAEAQAGTTSLLARVAGGGAPPPSVSRVPLVLARREEVGHLQEGSAAAASTHSGEVSRCSGECQSVEAKTAKASTHVPEGGSPDIAVKQASVEQTEIADVPESYLTSSGGRNSGEVGAESLPVPLTPQDDAQDEADQAAQAEAPLGTLQSGCPKAEAAAAAGPAGEEALDAEPTSPASPREVCMGQQSISEAAAPQQNSSKDAEPEEPAKEVQETLCGAIGRQTHAEESRTTPRAWAVRLTPVGQRPRPGTQKEFSPRAPPPITSSRDAGREMREKLAERRRLLEATDSVTEVGAQEPVPSSDSQGSTVSRTMSRLRGAGFDL